MAGLRAMAPQGDLPKPGMRLIPTFRLTFSKRCERRTLTCQLAAWSKFQGRSSSIFDCGWPAAIFSSVLLNQA